VTHVYRVGETVKLTYSTNPYVPKGSLLKIGSINSFDELLGVKYHGRNYTVHVSHVIFYSRTLKEKVTFT
jgi:hypothetical protein